MRSLAAKPLWLLAAVTVAGAVLRLLALGHGLGHHPDERHMVSVAMRLSWDDLNPKSFPYGTLPYYLVFLASQLLRVIDPYWAGYDGHFYIGRALAAAFGIAGIPLAYLLARRLSTGQPMALLAAAFIAFNPFHLQLSRFFTSDIFLATTSTLTLLALAAAGRSGKFRWYAASGAAIGLSLGIKVAALNLLAPLLAVLAFERLRSKRLFAPGTAAILAGSLVAAALVFLAVEPYAFLDWQTFRAHTVEQINMAKGEWRPPYTIQYENTAPYLYHLRQMAQFTAGYPVVLLAALGLALLARRLWKHPGSAELAVLAWVVPAFLSIGGFQVKFPRYLLPMYPVLGVLAAVGAEAAAARVSALFARYRARPALVRLSVPAFAALLAAWSFVWGAAMFRIYTVEHPYTLASRWIFANVPHGSRILGVHWDDRLPLHLPGFDPREYGYRYEGNEHELPVYEPDSPEKVALMAERLAGADFVVFPTQRIPISIPRVPDEFPHTTSLLRLLYGEQLGFTLATTVKNRPRFGPFTWNDDTADESLSVYDHPKVTVFRNTERLNKHQILNRILNAGPAERLPGYEEMLLRDAGTRAAAAADPGRSTFVPLLVWMAVLEVLTAIGLPLAALVFGRRGDGGAPLAKCFGLAVLTLSAWVLASLGVMKLTGGELWVLVAVLLGVATLMMRARFGGWRNYWELRRESLLSGEYVFFTAFVVFLIMRSFHPEIHWGEKPMDFTFLNFFTRLETLPPEDPWAAGQPMRYYYLGALLFALLHKLSALDTAVGYNMALVTLGALLVQAGFGVFRLIGFRAAGAAAGACAVTLLGNLEVLWLAFAEKKRLGFDLYWASSRGLRSPAITEYPSWSLLFGDLHAHVIALPFAVGLVGVATALLRAGGRASSRVAGAVAAGVLLGMLFGTNTWDFITFAGLLGLVLLARLTGPAAPAKRFFEYRLPAAAGLGLAAAAAALPLVMLFQSQSGSRSKLHWGWVYANEFNRIEPVLRHIGVWAVPILLGAVTALLLRRLRPLPRPFGAPLLVAALPLALSGAAMLSGVTDLPWPIIGLATALTLSGVLFAADDRSRFDVRFAGACAAAGGVLLAGTELLFLLDRMNTIFKFYNGIWLLLGIGAVAVTRRIALECRARRGALRIVPAAALAVTAVVWLAGASGGAINTWIMMTFQRIDGPRPTIDGLAYLPRRGYEIAALTKWLRERVRGVPVLLEAHGPSYQDYTRYSMMSGLPTVIGWEHHVVQRGTRRDIVERRKRDVAAIYRSSDPDEAVRLLARYGVALVVVGDLERTVYGRDAGKIFEQHRELFEPLARFGDTAIYRTVFTPYRAIEFATAEH